MFFNFQSKEIVLVEGKEQEKDEEEVQLELTEENLGKIKEIATARMELARAFGRLAKCHELIANNQPNTSSNFHLSEALKGYTDNTKQYQILFEQYVRDLIDEGNLPEPGPLRELSEQIYMEYDASLAKLVSVFAPKNVEKAIEFAEGRLDLYNFANVLIREPDARTDIAAQIHFCLASLFSLDRNSWEKSSMFCEKTLEILSSCDFSLDIESLKADRMSYYQAESLALFCDISIMSLGPDQMELVMDRALFVYQMAWQIKRLNDPKVLQMKYEATCRLCVIYRRLKMVKECLELLMDSLSRLGFEFQQLKQEMASACDESVKSECLVEYVECLFLIHRKIAVVHMTHASESRKSRELVEKSFLLSLKHVNDALTYLNYLRDFQASAVIEARHASVYYLLGKCHRALKNEEMELEMFANSLDMYEQISSRGPDDESPINRAMATDLPLSEPLSNRIFDSIRNDDDEETIVNVPQRIDVLYQYIEDSLIRIGKLKEALLVTERHRVKLSEPLKSLPEIVSFDQIEDFFVSNSLHAIIYLSRVEVSTTLNSWLITPDSGIAKFNQINFNQTENLIPKMNSSELMEKVLKSDEEEQSELLKRAYNQLIGPFENILTSAVPKGTQPSVFLVYDEAVFKIPFHALKCGERYLFERFELHCGYSLKQLYRPASYSQRYIKHQNESFMPMRVVASEAEMERLLSGANTTRAAQHQYDLLLLLVDSAHQDSKALNALVVNLLSKRVTKSVLLEFNYYNFYKATNSKQELVESEANAKLFLKRLYNKLVNRTFLKVLVALFNKQIYRKKGFIKSRLKYLKKIIIHEI